jgi:hypothetical protein
MSKRGLLKAGGLSLALGLGLLAWTLAQPGPSRASLPVSLPAEDERPLLPGYQAAGLDRLSAFRYFTPGLDEDGTVPRRVPKDIQALDQQKVAVRGFMVPAEFDGDDLRSFMLVKTRMVCCYGRIPRLNEWVMVLVPPGLRVAYTPDIPVRAYGRLSVGEVMEDGMSMGLYRLAADSVDQPQEPWGQRLSHWLASGLGRLIHAWRAS